MDREKVIEASGAVDWEPDPILGKSEEDARAEVIDVTFSWAATNTVAGHEIWNRAVAWQKGQSAKQQAEIERLREALESTMSERDTDCTACNAVAQIAQAALQPPIQGDEV